MPFSVAHVDCDDPVVYRGRESNEAVSQSGWGRTGLLIPSLLRRTAAILTVVFG